MKKNFLHSFILLIVCSLSTDFLQAQIPLIEPDPCGYPDTTTALFKIAAEHAWGYGYDTLQYDIAQWKQSPFVTVDSAGATVLGRTMFLLTIQDTASIDHPRKRVWIHARTHPGEVQGTWVTNEIINVLLSETLLGKKLRDSCVFNIMPMYNPDGVELGHPRENANGIDIESNWNVIPSQPEVNVLRNMFTTLMAKPNPILIALNMHSAYGQVRYFVYHDPAGTSDQYSDIEKKFIDTVRSNFPGGIAPYTYFVSWTNGTPTQYPESWFWINHQENVLALTYEDMNDPSAHAFDTTAHAICQGIADQLSIFGVTNAVGRTIAMPQRTELYQNYPNPFNPVTTISYTLSNDGVVRLVVYDALGREAGVLVDRFQYAGLHTVQFDGGHFSSGMYYFRLETGAFAVSKKMVLLK